MLSSAQPESAPSLGKASLPHSLQALLRISTIQLVTVPDIHTSDEKLRQSRQRFGDYELFASVIIETDGNIVIVRKSEQWGGGWSIPGGAVGGDEEIGASALREVREESGIEAELSQPLALVRTKIIAPNEGRLDYFLVVFRGRKIGGRLEPLDRDEIAEARLATLPEVIDLSSKGKFPSIHPHIDKPIIDLCRSITP